MPWSKDRDGRGLRGIYGGYQPSRSGTTTGLTSEIGRYLARRIDRRRYLIEQVVQDGIVSASETGPRTASRVEWNGLIRQQYFKQFAFPDASFDTAGIYELSNEIHYSCHMEFSRSYGVSRNPLLLSMPLILERTILH